MPASLAPAPTVDGRHPAIPATPFTPATAVAGGTLLVLMWAAVLPPANNPFLDDHLVYAGVLAALALTDAGDTLGLGRLWARTALVRRHGFLR